MNLSALDTKRLRELTQENRGKILFNARRDKSVNQELRDRTAKILRAYRKRNAVSIRVLDCSKKKVIFTMQEAVSDMAHEMACETMGVSCE